jgi:phosphate transport system permease protein
MTKGDRKAENRRKKEQGIRMLFFLIASASVITLSLIVVFLFAEGLPIFNKVSLKDFLLGRLWYPTSDPPDFGIFALIIASLTVRRSFVDLHSLGVTVLYLQKWLPGACGKWSSRSWSSSQPFPL